MKFTKSLSAIVMAFAGFVLCAQAQRTATAIPTVVNGFVVAITVTDGGAGYTNAPLVTISGGGGSGANATATVLNGAVDKVIVKNAGNGYSSTPMVAIAPPPSPKPPFSDGLVAYYPFNGNVNDSAGDNNMCFVTIPSGLRSLASDSAYLSSTTFGINRSGDPASALVFNGKNMSYARSQKLIDSAIADNFTMSIWSLAESTNAFEWGDNVLLMPTHGSVNYGAGNAGVGIVMNSTQVGVVGHSDNYTPIFLSAGIAAGTWHQVLVTCSNKVLRLFVDGNLTGVNDQSGSGYTLHPSSGDPYAQGEFWIAEGGGIGGCMSFNNVSGYLDEFHLFYGSASDFRIYNRALSSQEVADLYFYEAPEQPSLTINVKSVQVTMHVKPTKKYQLEASLDMNTWTKVGDVFTATTSEVTQEFNTIEVGRFFRLSEVK